MDQRILDQRLQGERRHHHLRDVCQLPLHDEAIGEADLLDRKVSARQFELLRQRHFVAFRVAQAESQEVGQLHHRLLCQRRIAADQRDDRVQRIEQKVRLELSAKCRELRRRQVRPDLRRMHTLGLQRAEPAKGELRKHQRRVDHYDVVTTRAQTDHECTLDAARL